MYDDPTRIGVEINRNKNETWEALIVRYATSKNLVASCLNMYNELIDRGIHEPYAALQCLAEHACTDVILDSHHVKSDTIIVN